MGWVMGGAIHRWGKTLNLLGLFGLQHPSFPLGRPFGGKEDI